MDYRFFVNIDNCLSDDRYRCFFYESRSMTHNRLRLYSPSSLGDGGSFVQQSADIASYVNRHPYLIEAYEVIFAIQRPAQVVDATAGLTLRERWDRTLLRKLVEIHYHLANSGIINLAGENVDCSISVFVINPLNGVVQIPDYVSGKLAEECVLLLEMLGMNQGTTRFSGSRVKNSVDVFKANSPDCEPALVALLNRMVSWAERRQMIDIVDYIRETIIEYFNINELNIQGNRVSEEVCAKFRIIEYATTEIDPGNGVMGFNDRCREHWASTVSIPDSVIEEDYALRLGGLRADLEQYFKLVSGTDQAHNNEPYVIPNDDAINGEMSYFAGKGKKREDSAEPDGIIKQYENHMGSTESLIGGWDKTYAQLSSFAENIKTQLDNYEIELRGKYAQAIESREESILAKSEYTCNEHTEKEIKNLKEAREKVLKNLEQSQIAPRILYQNQLDMENHLRQANEDIEFYIACIASVSSKLFLSILGILSVLLAVLYFILQRASFLGKGLLYSGMYWGAAVVFMACCWSVPKRLYRSRIKGELKTLKSNLQADLRTYNDNARKMRSFVNYNNQLDYIETQIEIREKAFTKHNNLKKAKQYYLTEAELHLEGIKPFDELISRHSPKQAIVARTNDVYPKLYDDGFVVDVVDCELFWPKRR